MKDINHCNYQEKSSVEDHITAWALPKDAIARLGRGDVHDFAYSPDGQYLAVATGMGIWIYTCPMFLPTALLDIENGYTETISFSPDCRWLVIYDHNPECLKIWDVQQVIREARMDYTYPSDHYRPKYVLDIHQLTNRTLKWCPQSGILIGIHEMYKPYPPIGISSFTFSSDGCKLVGEGINDKDTEILIWDMENGQQMTLLPEEGEEVIQWQKPSISPCGCYFVHGDLNEEIRIWNINTGKLEMSYNDFGVADFYPHYTSNGNLIAAGVYREKVMIWDVEKYIKIDEFELDNYYISRDMVRFSKDGNQLIVSIPNQLILWEMDEKGYHSITTLNGHTDNVDTLAYSSDGNTLAAAYWNSNVILWDITSKQAK